jgi:ribonuclease HI
MKTNKENYKKSLYLNISCDGGVYEKENLITWAYVITDNKSIVHQDSGSMNGGGEHWHNVEIAESEAIYKACEFCNNYRHNYKIYTDSQAVLDKIQGKVPNATKNSRIKAIQNILKEFKESPSPCSLTIQYKPRCSDDSSTYVHNLTKV